MMINFVTTREGSTIPQQKVPTCSLSSASQFNSDVQKFMSVLLERIWVIYCTDIEAGITDSYTPRSKKSQIHDDYRNRVY
jgi:hypothetical protein